MTMSAAADRDPPFSTHIPSPDFITGLIGWAMIPGKGYGVIALRDIPADTVLEITPVIVVDQQQLFRPDGSRSALLDYAFWWGDITDDPLPPEYAIVKGGYLALANHDPDGNSTIEQNRPDKTITWSAIRDIRAGEEITFDYDCDLWFDQQA